MEIEIKGGKFWMIQDRTNEKRVRKWLYDDQWSAMKRLKELLKTQDYEKVAFVCIDTSGKEWKISDASWSAVVMSFLRGTI